MSIHIDSNLRLEFGRQRQAELLQRTHRAQRERALFAELSNEAGPLQFSSRSIRHLRRNRHALAREAR
jgi:hypothetical protein